MNESKGLNCNLDILKTIDTQQVKIRKDNQKTAKKRCAPPLMPQLTLLAELWLLQPWHWKLRRRWGLAKAGDLPSASGLRKAGRKFPRGPFHKDSMHAYVYIYIYICMCMYIRTDIYTYIYVHP